MPTGYNYAVMSGEVTDLKDYISRCAKAFVIELRDKPDGQLELLELPSNEEVIEKESALMRALVKNDEQWAKDFDMTMQVSLNRYKQFSRKNQVKLANLLNMKQKVQEWKSPEGDYAAFVTFALAQLQDGINELQDKEKFYEEAAEKIKKQIEERNIAAFKNTQLKEAENELNYAKNDYEKRKAMVLEKNEWIHGIINSFN